MLTGACSSLRGSRLSLNPLQSSRTTKLLTAPHFKHDVEQGCVENAAGSVNAGLSFLGVTS